MFTKPIIETPSSLPNVSFSAGKWKEEHHFFCALNETSAAFLFVQFTCVCDGLFTLLQKLEGLLGAVKITSTLTLMATFLRPRDNFWMLVITTGLVVLSFGFVLTASPFFIALRRISPIDVSN